MQKYVYWYLIHTGTATSDESSRHYLHEKKQSNLRWRRGTTVQGSTNLVEAFPLKQCLKLQQL